MGCPACDQPGPAAIPVPMAALVNRATLIRVQGRSIGPVAKVNSFARSGSWLARWYSSFHPDQRRPGSNPHALKACPGVPRSERHSAPPTRSRPRRSLGSPRSRQHHQRPPVAPLHGDAPPTSDRARVLPRGVRGAMRWETPFFPPDPLPSHGHSLKFQSVRCSERETPMKAREILDDHD